MCYVVIFRCKIWLWKIFWNIDGFRNYGDVGVVDKSCLWINFLFVNMFIFNYLIFYINICKEKFVFGNILYILVD